MLFFRLDKRVTGIEPVARPWKGRVLPLYNTRIYWTVAPLLYNNKIRRANNFFKFAEYVRA